MTALAGLWRFDDRPDAADACARMLSAQELYGRHHCAQWSDTAIAVGRRLMRLLPEDAFDRQPLIGAAGRYVLVADVRLDNRNDLIEVLGIPAPQAGTLCDAAILLAAVERWDDSCVERLVGDYAFAVWDTARRRLLLARDPLGQRPLHYHRSNRFFAFASMPKGLHALSEVPYAPDEERISEFLVLMPHTGTRSFFAGIERVEPGHIVTVTPDDLATRRYWQPRRRPITLRRPDDYSDAIRELLDQAVSCRLRGTGDVGAYLSGGLDSGAVVATAARLLAGSNRRVIAFTGVPRKGYTSSTSFDHIINEWPNAAATAGLYPNIEHVLVQNEGRSPLADLDRRFFLLDQPVRGICCRGWSKSFENAISKRRLKVVLGGGLGNMGLSYSGVELLPELFLGGRWGHLWRESSALVAAGQMRWRGILARTFGPFCPPFLWHLANKIGRGYALDVGELTAINPLRLRDLLSRTRGRDRDFAYRPWKNSLAWRLHNLQQNDPGNYHKAGLAALQADYRDPTADIRLLEFCLGLPTEAFVSNGILRALARHALADRLPEQVLQETRASVQGADWHEDLTAARESVVDELDRLEACPAAATTIDLPRLRRLTEDWPAGGWERREIVLNYRYALLRAIPVGHFLRRATGSNR